MFELALLLLLLILSGFFSGSETALTSLSMARSQALAEEGRSGADDVLRLKQDPSRMLIILLIGNNLVNTAAAALATVVATEYFGHLGPGLAVGGITLLLLVFGEITPKTFGVRYSVEISLWVAPILIWLGYLFFPLVWLLRHLTGALHHYCGESREPAVTETEIITLAEHASRDGAIDADENAMIQRIFNFDDLRAMDIMVPRTQLFSLDGGRTVKDALPDMLEHPYTRIPIYQEHPEEIVKVINLRDILEHVARGELDKPLLEVGREPVFVADTHPVAPLFELLRANKHELVVVVDEFGALMGVITLEDILEELVGELDASDHPSTQQVKPLPDTDLLVEGCTEMRVIKSHFGLERLDLGGRPTASVNRWLLDHLQRIPLQGERFLFDGLEVLVEAATPRLVQTLRIHRVPGLEHADDDPAQTSEGTTDSELRPVKEFS